MLKVISARKQMLLNELSKGKPLAEAMSLLKIGLEWLIQEKRADSEFAQQLAQHENRASTRPSW